MYEKMKEIEKKAKQKNKHGWDFEKGRSHRCLQLSKKICDCLHFGSQSLFVITRFAPSFPNVVLSPWSVAPCREASPGACQPHGDWHEPFSCLHVWSCCLRSGQWLEPADVWCGYGLWWSWFSWWRRWERSSQHWCPESCQCGPYGLASSGGRRYECSSLRRLVDRQGSYVYQTMSSKPFGRMHRVVLPALGAGHDSTAQCQRAMLPFVVADTDASDGEDLKLGSLIIIIQHLLLLFWNLTMTCK